MQVFVVVAITGHEQVERGLPDVAPGGNFYRVKEDVWLVAYDGTTQQLAERLGIRDGTRGSGLVTPISSYSGRASADLWEWLKLHWKPA